MDRMEFALDKVRSLLLLQLNAAGVKTAYGWKREGKGRVTEAMAVVSIRSCKAEESACSNYLGQRYDEQKGQWSELYGWAVSLLIGADIYAPVEKNVDEMYAMYERMAACWTQNQIKGLQVGEISCGNAVYEAGSRLMKLPVTMQCKAYFIAAADQQGEFYDFRIEGELEA